MSIQKLHPFEKTSIQARHTIKRLEMLIETSRDENEKIQAKGMLNLFNSVRALIPDEYQDIDLKTKE